MNNKNVLYISGFLGNLFFERGIWILYLLSINFSMAKIGVLQSVLNLTMFVMEIPTGIMSDTLGRKKTLMCAHLFIFLYLLCFFISESFYILLLGHILYGIGLTMISGTDEATLYDSLKETQSENLYNKVIGIYNAIVVISTGIAIAVGGVIQETSWKNIFLFGMIAQLLALITVCFLKEVKIDENNENNENNASNILYEINTFFKMNVSIKLLIIGFSLFFSSTSVFYMFSQDMFKSSGMRIIDIGFLYAIVAVLQAIFSIYSYKFAEKFSPQKTLYHSFIYILLFFVLLLTQNIWIVMVSFVAISLLYEIVDPISSTIINDQIPSKIRATVLSCVSICTSFFMFIFFPVIGFLADRINTLSSLTVLGCISMVACFILIYSFFKVPNNIIKE